MPLAWPGRSGTTLRRGSPRLEAGQRRTARANVTGSPRNSAPWRASRGRTDGSPARAAAGARRGRRDGPTKRDRMIELAGQRRDLAAVPLAEVSKLASAVAAEIGYSPGTARRELVRHVRELQAASAGEQPADGERRRGMMTDRHDRGDPATSGTAVAVFIAAAVAVLVAVRWLARLDWPVRWPGSPQRWRSVLFAVLGGTAEAAAAAAPGAAHAAAGPAAAAPRPRARDGVRAVAAVGTAGGGPPGPAVPAVADLAERLFRPSQTSVLVGPRPLRARAAGPGRGARHLHRPAAQGQVRRAGGHHRAATRARWWSPRPAGTCTS